MICPRCGAEHKTISDNNNTLVPNYNISFCVICAYPLKTTFNTIDYMDSIFYDLYKSIEPYLSKIDKGLEPLNETMLKKLIDIALEENDEVEFMRLTKELKNLKSYER